MLYLENVGGPVSWSQLMSLLMNGSYITEILEFYIYILVTCNL